MKYRLILVIAALWCGFDAFSQSPWQEKVDPILMELAEDYQRAEMLLILKSKADISDAHHLKTKAEKGEFVFKALQNHAKKTQKELIEKLEENGLEYKSFFVANCIHVKANTKFLELLASQDEVLKIQANSPVKAVDPVKYPPFENQARAGDTVVTWGIEMIQADEVWKLGIRGEGVVIGGEDTGYKWDVPAIKEKYRGYISKDSVDFNYNWHDAIHEISPLHNDSIVLPSNNPCGLSSDVPCDDHGHGTHTMGTMVGELDTLKIGVAPDSKWIGCRNMERGWGNPDSYIECFEWFLAPTDSNDENPNPLLAPHVINNSWSCPEIEGCNLSNFSVMEDAVNALKMAGIVVVVSAGNSGPGCSSINTPAPIFANSFSVGATDWRDTLARFSSRGPVTVDGSGRLKPDISAPGVQVLSCTKEGGYSAWNGTSMAGPHVAGVVALMISANPALAGQVDTIESIIRQTAVPKTDTLNCGGFSGMEVPNPLYGWGRINALAAVQEALNRVTTSVDKSIIDANTLSVFPNPVSDQFSIETSGLLGSVHFRLYDLMGRIIIDKKYKNAENQKLDFDVAEFMDGIYLFSIQTEDRIISGKLIKQ